MNDNAIILARKKYLMKWLICVIPKTENSIFTLHVISNLLFFLLRSTKEYILKNVYNQILLVPIDILCTHGSQWEPELFGYKHSLKCHVL